MMLSTCSPRAERLNPTRVRLPRHAAQRIAMHGRQNAPKSRLGTVGQQRHGAAPVQRVQWLAGAVWRADGQQAVGAHHRERAGCRVQRPRYGGMAVGQAVDAFRFFTGREPDAARMAAYMLKLLAARTTA